METDPVIEKIRQLLALSNSRSEKTAHRPLADQWNNHWNKKTDVEFINKIGYKTNSIWIHQHGEVSEWSMVPDSK